MIISSVGYQTEVLQISANSSLQALNIVLKPKVKELENVKLEPYEKDGWLRWGKFFTENLIGVGENADDCRILNYQVIKFRNSRQRGELSAYAFEPLMIRNEALGYTIQYQMEEFTYNFRTNILFYSGFPLFTPMEGSERKKKRWLAARDDAYFGSQLHFMRSLYRNILPQEGFEMRRLVKTENTEKKRVRSRYKAIAEVSGKVIVGGGDSDSSEYYSKVLSQPDRYSVLSNQLLPADSIAFAFDSVTAGFEFADYLQIRYTKAKAPRDYIDFTRGKETSMISEINLVTSEPIIVQANGMHFEGKNLLSSGYWGWSEKMSRMLPFNFKPNKKAP